MADDVTLQSTTLATAPVGTIIETIDQGAGVQRQVVQVEPGTDPIDIAGSITATSAKGTTAFTDPACDTSADLLLAANSNRVVATIQNAGTVRVYLGPSGVTTSSGLVLEPGDTMVDEHSTSAWYGITASGTADLRVCEVS